VYPQTLAELISRTASHASFWSAAAVVVSMAEEQAIVVLEASTAPLIVGSRKSQLPGLRVIAGVYVQAGDVPSLVPAN
tara:strand:+ start:102 stop:335 length:234 start_codon:yes stop_codon:yes gene_type:complete